MHHSPALATYCHPDHSGSFRNWWIWRHPKSNYRIEATAKKSISKRSFISLGSSGRSVKILSVENSVVYHQYIYLNLLEYAWLVMPNLKIQDPVQTWQSSIRNPMGCALEESLLQVHNFHIFAISINATGDVLTTKAWHSGFVRLCYAMLIHFVIFFHRPAPRDQDEVAPRSARGSTASGFALFDVAGSEMLFNHCAAPRRTSDANGNDTQAPSMIIARWSDILSTASRLFHRNSQEEQLAPIVHFIHVILFCDTEAKVIDFAE